MSPLRRMLRRRRTLDFSDYLELRRMRDEGGGSAELDAMLAHAERELPVPSPRCIPHLATLADAPEAPPRGLTREAWRVVFEMRREYTQHGGAREQLMGFDLPDDGPVLKDWLDFLETERKGTRAIRELLRELDRKTWAILTGHRRMPTLRLADVP